MRSLCGTYKVPLLDAFFFIFKSIRANFGKLLNNGDCLFVLSGYHIEEIDLQERWGIWVGAGSSGIPLPMIPHWKETIWLESEFIL